MRQRAHTYRGPNRGKSSRGPAFSRILKAALLPPTRFGSTLRGPKRSTREVGVEQGEGPRVIRVLLGWLGRGLGWD